MTYNSELKEAPLVALQLGNGVGQMEVGGNGRNQGHFG
jgi:hypothetical protein